MTFRSHGGASSAPPSIPDRSLLAASAVAFLGFLAILLLVLINAGADPFDFSVAAGTQRARGSTATLVARIATSLGSFPVVVTVAILGVLSLWIRTRQLWLPAILASALAATASLVTLLKIAVARARPDVGTLIGNRATDFSFPSGHTTNGTLVYVLSALLLTAEVRRSWWRHAAVAVSIGLALLIGLSRIYLGYHWATDVLAGWLLAAGVITASLFSSRRLGLSFTVGRAAGSSATERDLPRRPTHLPR